MSPPRAAPHTAAAGLPRSPRLSAVGAALSPWKAPSWRNRGARSDRVTRDRFVRSDSPRTWKTLAPYRASLSVHTGSGTRFPHFPPAHLGAWSLLERTAPWRTSGAGPLLELQEPPAYLPAPVWPARARRPKPHRPAYTMPGSKTNPVSTVTGLHTEFLTVLELGRRAGVARALRSRLMLHRRSPFEARCPGSGPDRAGVGRRGAGLRSLCSLRSRRSLRPRHADRNSFAPGASAPSGRPQNGSSPRAPDPGRYFRTPIDRFLTVRGKPLKCLATDASFSTPTLPYTEFLTLAARGLNIRYGRHG